ncbi:MAG: insulinase family protein [Candidatus Xiphinematobacter sp.]|nr:MAG: insulinase family protein [Candidatus Xiphinematobacter sp.]
MTTASTIAMIPPTLPSHQACVYTFPNGMTLITDEDHSTPVASIQVFCATGSVTEGKWMGAGLSHILEHMLFKGTTTRKVGDIARQIQDLGGYINAYTWYDRTAFWVDIPSTGTHKAISILADAMMNSTIPEEEYAKEQEVIRREFAMGSDDPDRANWQLIARTVFSQSPYCHPIIGHLDIYNQLERKDVLEYYKKRYVPNNLTFVVVGDIDATQVREQLTSFFQIFPRRALEPVTYPVEPPQAGRRFIAEEFPTELSRVGFSWRTAGLTDSDTPILDVLATILGVGSSSVLNRELRERQRLVHSIASHVYTWRDSGIFGIVAVCNSDKRKQVESSILSIVEGVRSKEVGEQELRKAKMAFLSSELQNLMDTHGRAAQLGSSWLTAHNPSFNYDYLNAAQRVTASSVRTVARKYLRSDTLSVTELNPIGTARAEANAEIVPKPLQRSVRKFTLVNGLRVLISEDKRLPLAIAIAAFRGGVLLENAQYNGISPLLASTLLKGTKTRSAWEISNEVESLGGTIDSNSGDNFITVSVEMMSPYLKHGLIVLSDVIEHAKFPEQEVELEKSTQIAAIQSSDDQITFAARNLARRALFGSHPYGMPPLGTEKTVSNLTAVDLRRFKEEVLVAHNGVLAIFGDIKAESVLPIVEKVFGNLPSGQLAAAHPPLVKPLASRVFVEKISQKQQTVITLAYQGVDVTSVDRPAMELLQEASNDLSSRFFARIREKNALAYYVGASQMIGLVPGLFAYYLGTDPRRAKQARNELVEEINKVATEGLTTDELDRAKKKLLGFESVRSQNVFSFASLCATNELLGLGFDHYQKRSAEIQAVTAEEVQKVAQRYLGVPGCAEAVVRRNSNSSDL